LAFRPADMVIRAFVEMEDELTDAILNYFEPVFIGVRTQNRSRMEPRFQIQFWNVCENVKTCLPSTNNQVERWYNSFNNMVNSYHQSFWNFLLLLKREIDVTKKHLIHSLRGDEFEFNRRYEDNNTRILRLVRASVTDISTILSGIAYKFMILWFS